MSQNKDFQKLVNHVGHFLKAIGDGVVNGEHPNVEDAVRVEYNMGNNEAYIYISPHTYGMGLGLESTFDYSIIDKLADLSKKYTISYRIGQDEHKVLHFQIFV